MLKHYRQYVQDNPLPGYLSVSTIAISIFAVLYKIIPGPANMGPDGYICFALGTPTVFLFLRFSAEQREKNPVPPRQETAFGILSLAALACSILAEAVFFSQRFGLMLSDDVAINLLRLFGISAVAALILGLAVRNTKTGRLAMILSTSWITCIVVAGFVALARGWPRG